MPKDLESLIEVFTAPLIVWPSSWQETLPDWIKPEITFQRLIQVMKGEDDLATDVEALAYMYPRSLEAPLDHDWTVIYCYLSTKVMESRMVRQGVTVPDDVRVDKLDDYQEQKLKELKRWIRERQRKVLEERRRAEKKAEQEERRGRQLVMKF